MRYKKYLGQHFLHDTVKILRMINEINPTCNDLILEIGPGSGALTGELVKKAGKVIAVEIDKEAIEKLNEKIKSKENLEIINDDFLKIKIKKIYEKYKLNLKGNFLITGNIPYYITVPILKKIIEYRDIIDFAYLTIQKEVAERIVAKEGTKKYGSLSIFMQFYSEPVILFKINKKAFFPVPKVDSAFIKIRPKKEEYKVKDVSLFFKIVKSAFSQRRKMLLNNLVKSTGISRENIKKILYELNISEDVRAEQVSLLDFIKISDMIYEI